MVNWKSNQLEDLLRLVLVVVTILVVNQLVDRFPLRLDLTEEQRYSISEATQRQLENLEDVVYVEVYLEGELPSGFKRLQKSIRELLEQFAYYADDNVQFTFVDPDLAKTDRSKNEYYRYLGEKGIQPTNLSYQGEAGKTEKLIFPGAIVSYFGEEQGVMLLKGNRGATPDETLNQSIENLEYELISAIKKLASDDRKRIGLVKGHGELDSLQVAGFTSLLVDKYDVYQINLPQRTTPLVDYDLVILSKPTSAFSEKEKYMLDQYVMNGGRMMMFLDALSVNMDSASGEGTFAFPYNTNLNDLLFRYGVRINTNYIQDINCGVFPVVAGNMGDQAQIRMLPWPFFPLINAYGDHQIVRNLDASIMKFASTIDTVKAEGIKKTPLMLTSPYTRVLSSPVNVKFNDLRNELNPDLYNKGPQPVAYLLEGEFNSLYRNRLLPNGIDKAGFKETGAASRMLVVSDGDFIRNEFDRDQPQDLGYDPLQKVNYANKDFVSNALEYMLDDDGIINTRLKEIKIRPLDKVKVDDERSYWQVINLLLPLVVLVAFGIGRSILRKRKYTNH
ncbi:MAG: gliding motility-associated ABC transporter substrate-binding protein GldG [Cyclobacteriaceae bacterium]